jgi:hypothetical protein
MRPSIIKEFVKLFRARIEIFPIDFAFNQRKVASLSKLIEYVSKRAEKVSKKIFRLKNLIKKNFQLFQFFSFKLLR